MKVLSVKKRTGGRNIIFATGTPLSNTMAEMYTVQRYLDGEALSNLGVSHFDAWARVFGEVVSDWELSPSGQYKLNSRFAKFVNMPELMQRYLSFADVITNDDIKAQLAAIGKKLPLPNVKGGKPQNVVVERSADQAAYIGEGKTDDRGVLSFPEGTLVYRAENLPRKPAKGEDNMLKVMSDARKAALDMRLINPGYGDVPGSKVHVAADNMKRLYDAWNEQRGTQLVFIDLSTPQKARVKEEARIRDLLRRADAGDEGAQQTLDKMSPDEFMALDGKFSVYDDLKEKLVQRGIPEAEIAFIHDANTDLQKEELFGKVRSGRIRLLFGSTAKMGAGTNVQNRLVALHHLDAPWRPSDLEQRDGRGIRQGNELYNADPDKFEIEILRYATKNTLDARQWQTIEAKARFIQQMRKGGVKTREIEDIAGEAANAAEMKAAASGNPLILEEMDLRQKLRRLEAQATEHDREQHRIKVRIRSMMDENRRIESAMQSAQTDAERAKASFDGDFAADFPGFDIEKPKDMGAAIISTGRRILKDRDAGATLGAYSGFKVELGHEHTKAFSVILIGADEHFVNITDIDEADPVGVAQRIRNTVRGLIDKPSEMRDRQADIAKQVPALERQIGPWSEESTLAETAARHREVLAKLQPQPKPRPAEAEADGAQTGEEAPRASIDDGQPVARLSGDELGVDFNGPEDMPSLRRAAQRWYDDNLRGATAKMTDGSVVKFNLRGRNKTVSGGKGDILLRSVPAIREIIERGRVVHSEPGNKSGVLERLVLAAPVELAGRVHNLAVSVHRTADGQFHYDFTFDRDKGTGGARSRVNREGPLERQAFQPLPGLEVLLQRAAGDLNLIEWESERNKTATGTDVLSALDNGPAAPFIDKLIKNGWLTIGKASDLNAPAGAVGWTNADGTMYLAEDRVTNGDATAVLLHEAFHSGRDGLMKGAVWDSLMDRLTRLHRQFKRSGGKANEFFNAAATRASGTTTPELSVEEFGAYTVQEYAAAPGAAKRWVDDLIGAVKSWVLRRFGKQIGTVTPAELHALAVASLRARAVGAPAEASASASTDQRASLVNTTVATAGLTERRIMDEVRGKLTDLQPKALAALPLNYFTDLARPGMTSVGEYLRLKRVLDTYRGKKHAEADGIAQQWLKFARLGFGKNGKARAAQLASLMHDATLAGADPSKTDAETRARPGYDALRKRYMQLPPSGRALFQTVRDAYKAQAAELDKILLDNVRKAQEIARRRAEAEYHDDVAHIKAQRMSDAAKKDALDDAERAYKAKTTKAQWSMKARLTKMRIAFETSRVAEPYFPLARFGRYFAIARDVDGAVLSYSRREKAADRDRLAADLRKAYPTAKVEVGVSDNVGELRSAMDPRIVAEIEEIVGGAGLDTTTANTVLDQIWQRYLETMPDLSTRKRFIHRKGTAGFDADALRAFSSHMFHSAHQMGRLKYGLELQELVNEAADQARKSDDPTKGVTLANELRLRHKWVMNPTGGAVAQTMTSAAFVWYLGTTPAAALVNMSQTPMIGIPVLAGRFGGFAKAGAAILKAASDSVMGRGTVTRANLSADEHKAIEAFHESGLIDRTLSHDLAGVGETGVNYSPLRARVMAVMSWMFHRAEVWNREVTALAAYRLARKSGQNLSDAIDTAHDLTWKTHFDYSNASRPRIMQNDFAKVALVFRSYNLNMLYRFFRDFHQTFKGESAQARKEARYQLAGVAGMMSLMAGTTGMIGFNTIMAIAGAVLGDDDDPLDFEQRFKADVLDILGPELGGVVLNGVPGHYLGIDLTNRIGMPDLWFRSPNRDLQGKDEFDYWIMNSLGASLSMLGDGWRGISLLKEGRYGRAVESLTPKWARDLLKAYRYSAEGVTSFRGDQVLDRSEIDAWDIIAQAIGFTPAKVSETWERNNALKNAENRVLQKRRTLLNAYAMAVKLQDDDARHDTIEAIKRFNAVPINRPLAITPETIRRSLATRERIARKRVDGALIQNPELGRSLRKALPEPIYR